jgi:hypothetical protein
VTVSRNKTNDVEGVNLAEVVYVLRLARDGWPKTDWTTDGFASAVWNGFITRDNAMALTGAGERFLAKTGVLYPEED